MTQQELELEAEKLRQNQYIDGSITTWTKNDWQSCWKEGFIAGVNSKFVQIEKIKAQINENNSIIELVKLHSECKNERLLFVLNDRISELQQQLKKLET